MGHFRKLLALRGSERRDLVLALLVVAVVRLALWLVPLGSLLRLLERVPAPRQRVASDPSPAHLLWSVRAASRWVPRATCLTQALAARWLLARRGFDAVLRIGVTRSESGIQGHAWLERDGRVLIGGADPGRYAPLEPADESAA